MSVAFRRESDEAHLEPSFELPLPPGPNLVTARGLALIGARVTALEAELAGAADEDAAKRTRRELRYWHARASSAEPQPAAGGEEVAFGTRVTYRIDGRERTIALVGSDEAEGDPALVPFTAPLAQAMMGAAEGERVPFGGKPVEIVAIEAIGG